MKNTLLIITLLLCATPAFAQTGNCEQAQAEAYLDVNNVRARVFNNGALFWRGSPHVYEVPKYSGNNSIFATTMWIGGTVNGELRTAGSTYGPWEFWPGPLDDAGNPPADCTPFDRIYTIYTREIKAYDEEGVLSDNLRDWPWELGAPVIDGDGNPDNYNLAGGDRPEISGHQTLWWVMNDRGNVHERTDTDPIGLEVQVTAFAAASSNPHIDNTTLYRYTFINKGAAALENTYFGIFQDVDLGNFDDDYVGSDSTLGLGYSYNADNDDEGGAGYGEAPPAVGFDVIQGALVDNDGVDNNSDGVVDEPGERLSMTTFAYFSGGGGVVGDPSGASDFYNYMQGKWKDGMPFTLGGTGRDFSSTPTSFFYHGDPVTGEGWTELNPAIDGSQPPIHPADRRSIVGSGPFTIEPGGSQTITFAIVWARGADNLDSITQLRAASAEVQEAFEAGFDIELPAVTPLETLPLTSPANGVAGQPTNPILRWQQAASEAFYEIEIAASPDMSNATSNSAFLTEFQPDFLGPDSTYYWRVRALNAGLIGPWSETWRFSTSTSSFTSNNLSRLGFMAVQNAAGPIDPPDMAAFAFNSSGFPILEGNFTPEGSYPAPDRPTRGIQQSTNESAWGINTAQSFSFFGSNGESFFERAFPRGTETLGEDSFEWRFPQSCLDQTDDIIEEADCLAYRAFDDSVTIEVPFELWNIGSQIDPNDDYQMIPFICEEACNAGADSLVFDFITDHPISGGNDDPFSDWIYWMKPADNGATPGTAGYQDFFFGSGIAGEQVFAEIVLIQWNGGEMPPYLADLPEPGTIFRIANQREKNFAPILASPANGAILNSTSTLLTWNASPRINYQLQIDTNPDFESPDLNLTGLTEQVYLAENYPPNLTYYWRVRMTNQNDFSVSQWSQPWSFTIPLNVDNEALDLPGAFSLSQSYPNPFSNTTQIQYTLPEAAPVKLEVYDTLGRRVQVLVDGQQPAGRHQAIFNANNLSNGTYFYRLTAGDFHDTKTLTLIR